MKRKRQMRKRLALLLAVAMIMQNSFCIMAESLGMEPAPVFESNDFSDFGEIPLNDMEPIDTEVIQSEQSADQTDGLLPEISEQPVSPSEENNFNADFGDGSGSEPTDIPNEDIFGDTPATPEEMAEILQSQKAEILASAEQTLILDGEDTRIRYLLKVKNSDAENTAVTDIKVMLPEAVSYMAADDETKDGLLVFESADRLPEGINLNEAEEELRAAYANGNVVMWLGQSLAPGEERTYSFAGKPCDTTMRDALGAAWLVDGRALGYDCVTWTEDINPEENAETPADEEILAGDGGLKDEEVLIQKEEDAEFANARKMGAFRMMFAADSLDDGELTDTNTEYNIADWSETKSTLKLEVEQPGTDHDGNSIIETVWKDFRELDETDGLPAYSAFQFFLEYHTPQEVRLNPGDKLTYQLPDWMGTVSAAGNISIPGQDVVGSWVVGEDNKLVISLDDSYLTNHPTGLEGTIELTGTVKTIKTSENTYVPVTIQIGDVVKTFEIKERDNGVANIDLKKERTATFYRENNSSNNIEKVSYSISVIAGKYTDEEYSRNNKNLENVVIEDTFTLKEKYDRRDDAEIFLNDQLKKYLHYTNIQCHDKDGNLVNIPEENIEIVPDGASFKIKVGNLTPGQEYTITYDVEIDPQMYTSNPRGVAVDGAARSNGGGTQTENSDLCMSEMSWIYRIAENTAGVTTDTIIPQDGSSYAETAATRKEDHLIFNKVWNYKGASEPKAGWKTTYYLSVNEAPAWDIRGWHLLEDLKANNQKIVSDIRVIKGTDWNDPGAIVVPLDVIQNGTAEQKKAYGFDTLSEDGFDFAASEAVNYRFVFDAEYYGPKTAEEGTVTMCNRTNLTPGVNSGEQDYGAYKEPAFRAGTMTKRWTSTDMVNSTVSWQTTIDKGIDVKAGDVYYDFFGWKRGSVQSNENITDASKNDHIMPESPEDLRLEIVSGPNETPVTDGYELKRLEDGDLNEVAGLRNDGFKIVFTENVEGPVLIRYKSKADFTRLGKDEEDIEYSALEEEYINQALLKRGENQRWHDQAIYRYRPFGVINKTAVNFSNENPYITWTISVNGQHDDTAAATIKDRIPEGLEFDPGEDLFDNKNDLRLTIAWEENKVTGEGAKGQKLDDYKEHPEDYFSFHYDPETRFLTIELKKLSYTEVKFELKTRPTVDSLIVKKDYTNTAELYIGDVQVGSSSAVASADYTFADKSCTYDETTAPNATFTVDVNPAGIMLADEPGKMITVSDDFSQTKMILLPETFRVMNSAGAILAAGEDYEVTFDPKMKGFTLLVPDQTKLKVEYQVYVPGKVGTGADVSNSVKLSYDGKELKTVDYIDTKNVVKGSGTVNISPRITIIKFEEGDYNKKLEGAEFTVAPYIKDEETGKYKADSPIGIIRTNGDGEADTYTGKIALEDKQYYCFWESKAPKGYVLDPTVHPFVILGQEDDTANIPDEIQQVYRGFKFSVQDIVSTEVNVEKIWNDGNDKGNTRPDSVTIKLLKDGQETDKTLLLNEENGWKGTFGNLEKFENGSEIAYSIAEVPVAHYFEEEIKKSETPDENGAFTYTVKNTLKTEISGEKKWNDGNSTTRPASITVHIMNGETIAKSVTLSAGDDGIWDADDLKFSEELPMYDSDGNEILYTIKEDAVDGYFTAIQGTVITNTETTTVSGTKNWNDTDAAQRPQAITVLIKNGNTEVKKITVMPDASGEWKYSETLPKYDSNGTLINYTVEEVPVDGYQSSVEGYSITNTEVTEISGQKKWEDSDNADNLRPVSTDKVGLTLYKQVGASEKEIVQNAAPVWEEDLTGAVWTFQYIGLPAVENGQKVIYSVDETTVPDGYTKNVTVEKDGTVVITNTHIPEVTSLAGTKTWEDNNDQDGLRPESMKLTLYKLDENGKEAAVEASPVWSYNKTDKVWNYTYSDLQKNQGGKPITYFVKEEKIPDGYTVSYDDAKQNITNTHIPGKTQIAVNKNWEDNNNQDGKRPASITISLLANRKKKDSKEVTSKDGWTCTFENLDKYEDGKEIEYTIEEEKAEGYTTEIEGSAEEGFIVTNTHTPEKTRVAVSKNWEDNNNQDGKRPASITINLLANGKKKDSRNVTSKDSWTCTFEDLDKYEDGKEIKYTIEEEKAEGYTTEIEGSAAEGFVVTNTHTPEKTEITVSKSWKDNDNQDGKRPTEITINLLANGKKKASKAVTAKAGWTCTFENLDKYEDGKEIEYTIEEEKAEGYTTEIEGSAEEGFVVTNTHTPEKTRVAVSKNWEDNNNQDGKRPASITINLLANGKKKGSKAVISKDSWTCTFEDLDKYEDGKEIKYTIEEEKAEGYTTEIEGSAAEGFVVTNTHTPEKTEITVSKSWKDNDNQDGKRPTRITINLLANGKKKDSKEVTSKTDWTCTFEKLDKYKDGKEIEYTIREEEVEGYTAEIGGSAEEGFIVTNTHTPEKTQVSVSKNWEDNNNQDGKRPTRITINLLANGKKKDSKEVTSKDSWTCTFEDLDKYKDGKEIEYTIEEKETEGYTTKIEGSAEEGFTVTNTHIPEQTEITGSKIWKDNDNQDGKRPTSITVNLLADGEKTDSINVTAETGWKWTFADLPKYAEGKEIHYTVSEEAVENYSTAYSLEGYDITNSYTPGKTAVSGNKIWKDGENQDGIRPESITIHLLADGERVDSRTVTEEDNWKWTFTDLDEYKNGKKIVYTVEEDTVEYYETEIKDYNVINTHTPETINIPVEKQWNDAEDEESRPASIDVILMRGGDIIRTMTLNQANNWKGTFTDLPRYESGEEIVYTVEEADVEGYITETKVTEEGEILIINTPTKVTIKKVDENNEFVSGAGLAVRDSETGMDVVTLITDDKAIDITGKLTAGKTYYLTETSVPDGYLLAEDVEFTVPEDGSALEVTMVDRKKQEGGKVGQLQVTKQIALLNNDMEFALYAVDATYYVRLFTDPEALHPYGEAKAVHIVNGSGASVSFGNLPEGTYYVRETLADGTPLPMEELIDDTYICIAAEDGSEEVEIAAGTKAETGLVNIYYDIPDGYFISASIDITKEVLKNGETLETDDVFYAGIFTSKTEEPPILVEALVNNGTVTVEVPLGGEDGKQPVTYYVFETDASGKKLNKKSFAYTVSGEGGMLLDMENLEGAVTIINEKKEEEITTPAPSITPTPVNAQGSSGSSGTPRSYSQGGKVDPVKTGDHTNANLYLLLLALASVTAGAAVTKKKKAK